MTILIMNNTEFNDIIYQYYATLIIRKIVVLFEISPNSQIFEELLEVNILKSVVELIISFVT